MRKEQFNVRLPERTRSLIRALAAQTGMTITQVFIQAVECLAEKYNVKLPERPDLPSD